MRDLIGRLTARLNLRRSQVERTVALFDEDNTVPFIARYRKEVTGGLDEEQLAEFRRQLDALRSLAARQETVLRSIEEQGKLTPELAEAIEEVETLQELEDLYLPYKPKRRTRAQIARELGLEPLAMLILEQAVGHETREELAAAFLGEEVASVEDALQGARDIVAEAIAEDAGVRDMVRRITWERGLLVVGLTDAAKDPKRTFEMYYEFSRGLGALKPHQVLAVNRGEQEGALRVKVDVDAEGMMRVLRRVYPSRRESPFSNDLHVALEDAYSRLIGPAIEREVRRDLKAWADEHAINVFATNLRGLLLTPPIKGVVTLGIDPGYRTGCKVAIVDETGKVLHTTTIYPHEPRREWAEALIILRELADEFKVGLIAIGNGTASRETEELAAELIRRGARLRYLIVSEAGASVYSASPLARAELPGLDVSLRGAVSIARRAQDPLAELVKIDPKSIGVGMYQHDVDQKALADALEWVTQSVVNAVGVDVNTASPALLQYVAGLGPKLAERVVEHRNTYGLFETRDALRKVKGLGEKTFQQAAGFLRVPESWNLLDRTGVHPESYKAARDLLRLFDLQMDDPQLAEKLAYHERYSDMGQMARRIGVGVPTLKDIFAELQRPGRDPREDIPAPILRRDVLRMEDLKPGMRLKGTVRNVVDFGAFVDIGVKQDGLIHVSEMADRRIDSPYEVLNVGDVVEVTVITVDPERGRIGLSLRS